MIGSPHAIERTGRAAPPDPADLARLVDGTGLRRRLQSLIAHGFTEAVLSAELQLSRAAFSMLLWSHGLVDKDVYEQVKALHGELQDADPTDHGISRVISSYCRTRAGKHGWLPPEAWTEQTIDDPAAAPGIAPSPRRPTP